jgi:hypothetical protein
MQRNNRLPTTLLTLYFVFSVVLASAASVISELRTLEDAVNLTISRLESGIGFDYGNDEDFCFAAGQQLQLSLLSLDAGHLLQEDYYNLSLYIVARSQRHYAFALELLQRELQAADFRFLQSWLKARIVELEKLAIAPEVADYQFSVAGEFSDLRHLLHKNGVK